MSVMAIIALVLAILGLLISWIPLINVLGWILLLPALVLGIIAIVKTGPNGAARGRGLAIAATIVTVLALILTIAFQALYASIFSKVGTDLETLEKELKQIEQQNTPGLPNLELPTDADSGVAVEGEGDVDNGNYRIKLVSVTKTGVDYEDRPTAVLTYELTNQRSDDNYSIFDVHMQAFQNGVELENAVYGLEAPEGYDPLSLTAELKPGATKTVVIGFVLKDPSAPVLIEAEGFFSDGKVYKEFPIQ
ncbi:DUF5067 domain-containing protein [Schaalia canis]|uniref:DUF5067 domain-containing protein n=2 Tax=Schaalia canis TaxID=100469 RepID=A0A3P1SCS0_9ACTO|nr:DUF5067 domain-containing protein [Schaalia canis]